ncbi:MAG: glutamine-hydrolyzing carbamoyl-phosphate synthase small subunit [Calditrichaeota bacterium]|nr:glutamine-hydrolyzing carbamoyl-phosphate synthase small subunit [Calditrichota bacterium]MCB0298650.1 glutamine-hydrolyzing carbamoyl-phosphate synthase small subunit [Calditrichota bacterium]HQU71168.1 glutamine-hydrolyzing carbamoyl-phosphate synthase small subunit [Calditrichia bacterium]HQV31281.1 glutamine-hydrolyzing carbamoyl-phosphate synthase small subunit [Calditrichia bacterium]
MPDSFFNPASAQKGRLILEDGSEFTGFSFGYPKSVAGEVVFNTGMVGYPDSMTDPSYLGQILTVTYPLVGNYGIPDSNEQDGLDRNFESSGIQIQALLVADYSPEHSHWKSVRSLGNWLESQQIPALTGIDTRALTKKLRDAGTMLGKIEIDSPIDFYDPNEENLVAKASIREPVLYEGGPKKVALIDCGAKYNIVHSLRERGLSVLRVPWNYDLSKENFDGLMVSNGPGDPQMCGETVAQIRGVIGRDIPVFGICMGHQLLSMAAGASTYKLKFGHRSQNQPVLEVGTNRCLVTSQNHGFAVDAGKLDRDWEEWFINLNDDTNEGIRHKSGRFMSVQFHPEATPGPVDAGYLFDRFRELIG